MLAFVSIIGYVMNHIMENKANNSAPSEKKDLKCDLLLLRFTM